MSTPRTINHGRYELRKDWPKDIYVQGGSGGLVLPRTPGEGQAYTTAFVEAFPPGTFIRGEGPTLVEAEEAAWEKYARQQSCPGHTFETRGYRNGAGICTTCGMFASDVFDITEVGHPCSTCGVGTNWQSIGETWFCQAHALPEDEIRRRRAELRAEGVYPYASQLEELLDWGNALDGPHTTEGQPDSQQP